MINTLPSPNTASNASSRSSSKNARSSHASSTRTSSTCGAHRRLTVLRASSRLMGGSVQRSASNLEVTDMNRLLMGIAMGAALLLGTQGASADGYVPGGLKD